MTRSKEDLDNLESILANAWPYLAEQMVSVMADHVTALDRLGSGDGGAAMVQMAQALDMINEIRRSAQMIVDRAAEEKRVIASSKKKLSKARVG